MQSTSVGSRPLSPPPSSPLVPWDLFSQLWDKVNALEAESRFWQTANTAALWFTRQQAMAFLGVGSTKLWELQKAGALKTSGTKYEVQSCRAYLLERAVSAEIIQERLQKALSAKHSN